MDIIISILRDHEEALSNLADRFDGIYNEMSAFGEKISKLDRSQERSDGSRAERLFKAVGRKGKLVPIKCKDWLTFQSASHGALLVTFEATDDGLIFSSVSDLFVFTYSGDITQVARLIHSRLGKWAEDPRVAGNTEMVPSEEFFLQDGSSDHEVVLAPTVLRKWLSAELGVPEERVVEARVL